MEPPRQLLHTIRLAGPWEFALAGGEWHTIKVPATWGAIFESLGMGAAENRKPVHFRGANGDLLGRRKFQRPTGLDAGVRVWIVVPVAESENLRLRINDLDVPSMASDCAFQVTLDITDLLRPGNVITIAFDIDRWIVDDAAVFPGAFIEIRTAGGGAE